MEDKIKYVLVKDFYKVNDYLYTISELNTYPYGTLLSKRMFHYKNGKWEKNPIIDDLSLVIKSKDGLVFICGCCHSGLLNVCSYASKVFNTRILTIIGGMHMLFFSKKEIENVGLILGYISMISLIEMYSWNMPGLQLMIYPISYIYFVLVVIFILVFTYIVNARKAKKNEYCRNYEKKDIWLTFFLFLNIFNLFVIFIIIFFLFVVQLPRKYLIRSLIKNIWIKH